jgi:hypothetical protein
MFFAVGRDPWITPMDSREKQSASDVKSRFAEKGGGKSDHLALAAAFAEWQSAHQVWNACQLYKQLALLSISVRV